MKIRRTLSRSVLSLVLVGLTMQHSVPLFAQKDEVVNQLEKAKMNFNKIARCALSKEGCTEQEALQLRIAIGSIMTLLLIAGGISFGVFLRRRGKPVPTSSVAQQPKVPLLYEGWLAWKNPELFETLKSQVEQASQGAKAVTTKAKRWYQRN